MQRTEDHAFEEWFKGFFHEIDHGDGTGSSVHNAELIKATLKDYHNVQRQIAAALHELTAGKMTSCNYNSEDIVATVRATFGESIVGAMNSVFGGDDVPFPSAYVDAAGLPVHDEAFTTDTPTEPPKAVEDPPTLKAISFPVSTERAKNHPWYHFGPARPDRFPQDGDEYEHYKGGRYYVICVASFSEARWLKLVIYRSFRYGYIWARPLAMWNQQVKVNGESVPRFKKVE
jgi:hypothetical protein